MLELKTILEMDVETAYEIFGDINGFVDEPVSIKTEEESYVIMTADDFVYLQNRKPASFALSCDMLTELETLSIDELETIISLVSSQLNLKIAKQYFKR